MEPCEPPFGQLLDEGCHVADAPCIVLLLLVIVVRVHGGNLPQHLHTLQPIPKSLEIIRGRSLGEAQRRLECLLTLQITPKKGRRQSFHSLEVWHNDKVCQT